MRFCGNAMANPNIRFAIAPCHLVTEPDCERAPMPIQGVSSYPVSENLQSLDPTSAMPLQVDRRPTAATVAFGSNVPTAYFN